MKSSLRRNGQCELTMGNQDAGLVVRPTEVIVLTYRHYNPSKRGRFRGVSYADGFYADLD
jgi:hypothetical protein